MRATLLKAFALLLVFSTPAVAQDYPSKPLRLIIPFAPGGSVDIVARLAAQKLGDRLGKQVLAENRAGAGGIIGLELAIAAPPDGHTLVLVSLAHAVNPHINKLNYDTAKVLSFAASLGNGPSVFTVHPSVPATTVKELIALAKAKPGTLHFAHAGVGSFTHTASVLFSMMAGIDTVMVPFKGGGPAMIDVLGGHSQLLMNSYLASLSHVRAGKLRALGVSDTRRSHLLPGVPTIDESGVPGYQAANWWGIAVPAGTPKPIVERLNKEINAALNSDEVKKIFDEQGAVPVPMSIAEFTKFYDDEVAKWGKVVKAANIKPE
ncbi:MAG: tripartite tricarboxylate transporter substrate binding protein [Xanthobacteraceae bacterium]|jgi:tripartite-type tricarboxylate transporter receptor subunit TctC